VTTTTALQLTTFQIPDSRGDPVEPHIYLVMRWHATPRNLLADEHDEVAWFTIDEACLWRLRIPKQGEVCGGTRTIG
jgi:hypothetical protein